MKQWWVMAALLAGCALTTAENAGTGGEEAQDREPGTGRSSGAATVPGESPASEAPANETPANESPASAGESPARGSTGTAEPAPAAETVAPPPGELECVSAPSQGPDESHPSVWRAMLYGSGERTRATFTRGPLFPSHAGVWSDLTASVHVEQLVLEGPLRFTAEGETEVSLDLAKHGLFFSGELELDGSMAELLCWDRLELFGSSWASEPRAFPAHYDPALGRCTGSEGEPAINVLPIEFVLEARYGECADLRGVALNRDDYGQPDLSLNLRGAHLEGARLHFANLSGSFEGARLGGFDFGYARVSGSGDAWTELPEDQSCEVTDSPWAGKQLTCLR